MYSTPRERGGVRERDNERKRQRETERGREGGEEAISIVSKCVGERETEKENN